jgi:hypothetical protein
MALYKPFLSTLIDLTCLPGVMLGTKSISQQLLHIISNSSGMIQLTDNDIKKFQALYKAHFGISLSEAEARDQGMKLIRLILLVCEKPCEEETKENKNYEKHKYKFER